jgi:hypothetical protein
MVKSFHELSGWGWDDAHNHIVVDSDVWDAHVNVHCMFL